MDQQDVPLVQDIWFHSSPNQPTSGPSNADIQTNTATGSSQTIQNQESGLGNIDWALGNLECVIVTAHQNATAYIYNLKQELLALRYQLQTLKLKKGESLQEKVQSLETNIQMKDKIISEYRLKNEELERDLKRIDEASINDMATNFQLECTISDQQKQIKELEQKLLEHSGGIKPTASLIEELQDMINKRSNW